MITSDLLPYQYDFVKSDDSNLALIAGVGTGKTYALAMFVLRMLSEYPKSKGMLCANTYSQLVNSTLTPLFAICDAYNIPYKTAFDKRKIQIKGTTIYVYSLEKYENIRGIEVGWIGVDEFFLGKSDQPYKVIKTRLRDKKGPLYFRATTTKNGYNWGYDMYSSPQRTNNFGVLEAKTSDNFFLPPQYTDDLLEDYGSFEAPMYRQEVLNEYVNLTSGSVYWSFDRKSHVKKLELNKNLHTFVGVDFNIDNMNAIYVQMIGDTFYVCRENNLTERNANTFTLAETIRKELYEYPYRSVIPDSTGKARKTSSQRSDHQILMDAGLRLEQTQNPMIRDRQNAVNRCLTNSKMIIDPSCTTLIRELETLSNRDDEGKVSHVGVALGYVIHKLAPIIRNSRSRSIQL